MTVEALRLYLVRHGETEWSVSGQHTGRTDIPLTAAGEDQARALAPWLAEVRFTAVFTSPRRRARLTCERAGLGDRAAIEPDLAEWDYGAYEGRRSADITRERPGWSLFRDGCPGGESPEDVSDRADRLIEKLGRLNGPIALFSHGQFIPSLAARWISLTVPEAAHLSLSTGSLSILETSAHHPGLRVISLWNAAPGGLAGLPELPPVR